MTTKPNLKSITIRDFQLVKDGSPVFYSENFQIRNGLLVPGMFGMKMIDNNTATLTKLHNTNFTKLHFTKHNKTLLHVTIRYIA